MDREAIGRRVREAGAWLVRATEQPPRLTAWGWAADTILAVALCIGAVTGVMQHGDDELDFPGPAVPMFPAPSAPSVRPVSPAPPGGLVPDFGPPQLTWWHLVLAILTALPLVTRRRIPLASFWIIALAASQLYQRVSGADASWTVVASVIAAYSAATYSRYRNLAVVSVVFAAVWVIASSGGDLPGLPSGLLMFLLLASVGLAANAIHTLRQRAQNLQREQEAATRLAIDRERARLARELHDVVGHNVSVMVVQAGAARKVMDTAPNLAREALQAVEAGGRAAMAELRQVIGLLTDDSGPADLAPQPGLAQLPQLAARIRDTGVPVTLTVTGTFQTLPSGVELAAYRVVQEALTNAVKHASGAAVTIEVTGSARELRMEVTDTGDAAPAGSTAGGRGLAGLRERLSVYGGTLSAGRRPTGGYRLLAVIPLRGDHG